MTDTPKMTQQDVEILRQCSYGTFHGDVLRKAADFIAASLAPSLRQRPETSDSETLQQYSSASGPPPTLDAVAGFDTRRAIGCILAYADEERREKVRFNDLNARAVQALLNDWWQLRADAAPARDPRELKRDAGTGVVSDEEAAEMLVWCLGQQDNIVRMIRLACKDDRKPSEHFALRSIASQLRFRASAAGTMGDGEDSARLEWIVAHLWFGTLVLEPTPGCQRILSVMAEKADSDVLAHDWRGRIDAARQSSPSQPERA